MKNISIITGATSGIGFELAKLIAKEDTDILIISRDEKKLIDTKNKLSKISSFNIEYLAFDLSEDIDTYIEKIKGKCKDKKLLYFINNAGFGDFMEFSSCDIKKQNKMINLNILALTNLTKIYFDLMEGKSYDSYLLNVSSVASYMPGPLMSVYYATKAYVSSFTLAIAYENRNRKNIHIKMLCPGPTNTNFIKSSSLEDSGLFNNLKSMSAKKVALITYNNLKNSKVEIIPGFLNKLSLILVKFLPRNLVTKATYFIMKRK